MNDRKVNLGGLWKNVDKNGNTYLSGKLGNLRLMVFPNDKKGNDKAPDYRIVLMEPEHEKAAPSKTEEIPF